MLNRNDGMLDILNTGINNVKNVQRYMFGIESINSLHALVNERRNSASDIAVYFVDCFFKGSPFLASTDLSDSNAIIIIIKLSRVVFCRFYYTFVNTFCS